MAKGYQNLTPRNTSIKFGDRGGGSSFHGWLALVRVQASALLWGHWTTSIWLVLYTNRKDILLDLITFEGIKTVERMTSAMRREKVPGYKPGKFTR